MRRFLIVVALSMMVAVGVVNSAMAAGTVAFSDNASFSTITKTYIAKETIKKAGGTAQDYNVGIWFQLSGFDPLTGGDQIQLSVPNATFKANGANQLVLIAEDHGSVFDTDTKIVAVADSGWAGSSVVSFTYTGAVDKDGNPIDLNGKKLVLGYDDDGIADAVNTTFTVALDLAASLYSKQGMVQVNLDKVAINGVSQEIGGIKGAVYAQVIQQIEGIAKFTGPGLPGYSVIDVNQGRKFFADYVGDDTSTGMAFQIGQNTPAFGRPFGVTPGYGVTADILDKISVNIKTNIWTGIKATPKAKAITIKTDDNKTISGNAIFGDDNKTFTLEVTNDDNQTAILNAKYLTVSIKVDGAKVLQTRAFTVGTDFVFASAYMAATTSFAPVTLGEWKINGYQGVVPYVSTASEFGSTIVLNNTSLKTADVFVDVISTDVANFDVTGFQNIVIPGKASIGSMASLTILPEDLAAALKLPDSVKQYGLRVTVGAPVNNVTGLCLQNQGAGVSGQRVIPIMTEGDVNSYLVQ